MSMTECIRCLSLELELESMCIPTPVFFGPMRGEITMRLVGFKVSCTSCGERWTVNTCGEIYGILNERGSLDE